MWGWGIVHDRPSPFSKASELVEEMQRHGVERALIYHVQGEAISAIWANEALLGWAGDAFRLQWVAGTGDDILRQLGEFHSTDRVESVRLHSPEKDRVPFVDWLYGPLLEWLSAEKIPLWVSLADSSPGEIMNTLRLFPDLTVVLVGAHYSHSTMVGPMLRKLPKAYLELSRFENLAGIETLIDEFGAKRLLYGSYSRAMRWVLCFSICTIRMSTNPIWQPSVRAIWNAYWGADRDRRKRGHRFPRTCRPMG